MVNGNVAEIRANILAVRMVNDDTNVCTAAYFVVVEGIL